MRDRAVVGCAAALDVLRAHSRPGVPVPVAGRRRYIGYAIPAIAGLLLFPRTAERGVSRFRVVLDGLVIAASVLVISWVLVLQSVAHTE
jgi:hypothetical protein